MRLYVPPAHLRSYRIHVIVTSIISVHMAEHTMERVRQALYGTPNEKFVTGSSRWQLHVVLLGQQLPKVLLPKGQRPKLQLPRVQRPKVQLPRVQRPKVQPLIATVSSNYFCTLLL